MKAPPLLRPAGATMRRLDLAAPAARLPSELEIGNTERAALYATARWHRERRRFLDLHPLCGCGEVAIVVDHRDGHQSPDWRARFWDPAGWQPMCASCHGAKSRDELTSWRQAGNGIKYPSIQVKRYSRDD